MKLCVSYCLDVFVEADNADEAFEQAEGIVRPILSRLSAGRVDIQAAHTGTYIAPEQDDVVGAPIFDEARGRHDPEF